MCERNCARVVLYDLLLPRCECVCVCAGVDVDVEQLVFFAFVSHEKTTTESFVSRVRNF